MLAAAPADAQQGSEDCLRLEAQLAGLDRSGPKRADPRQLEQSVARQQNELDRTNAYARGIGCGKKFLFFGDPPAECGPLGQRIKQMEVNLDRLQAQAAQASQGGGMDPRRRELLFALARGQCGPQYRLVERRVAPTQQQEKRGFLDMLFGGGGRQSEDAVGGETVLEPEMEPGATPHVSTFRTVCVRACDGFFFPISYQTTKNAFNRDEAICHATCPGAEAKLFAYPNPGGKMEMAFDVDGQPYTKLENAFRYRKEFVAGCSCKPEGMNWAEALQGVDDKTVKKGDIVIDEKTANDMNRAKSPEEAQAAAQALARQRPKAPAQPTVPAPTLDGGTATPDPTQTGASPRREAPTDDVIILRRDPVDRGQVERRPVQRRPLDQEFESPPNN
ncbi:DUF2865 domain-containing protein [Chenggangzhangella methanolivorans]|uniref:DUF2865 domain-containing protein n=1 Tax=Chenggangzhangella methanolivorans TaxID=1437009 RepID=UPI0021BD0F0F|nr:DUF2865 domain-containing protein [Chenggangzhangella methanolivorans]